MSQSWSAIVFWVNCTDTGISKADITRRYMLKPSLGCDCSFQELDIFGLVDQRNVLDKIYQILPALPKKLVEAS
jgi:hypothetical protein